MYDVTILRWTEREAEKDETLFAQESRAGTIVSVLWRADLHKDYRNRHFQFPWKLSGETELLLQDAPALLPEQREQWLRERLAQLLAG